MRLAFTSLLLAASFARASVRAAASLALDAVDDRDPSDPVGGSGEEVRKQEARFGRVDATGRSRF